MIIHTQKVRHVHTQLVVSDDGGVLRQFIITTEAETGAAIVTIFIITRLRAVIENPLRADAPAYL
ncbi:hypothetical protein SRABI106_00146 [Rahnella aquatilis]|nr:hypothetical protein SRABI106_00146 [Rahnella aquatilis]